MVSDRLKRALTGFIRVALRPIDYFAFYEARVVSQNATDLSLDILPKDPRFSGVQRVPLRLGIPGVTAKVAPGGQVFMFFEGGSPSAPACMPRDGLTLTELVITANTKVTVNAPDVRLGDGHADVVRYGDAVSLAPTGVGPLNAAGVPVAGIAIVTLGAPQVANPLPTKVKA